ncbi:MAG: non-homologous end-joining DNA ligase [Propioniciclava sp.]
MSEVTTEVAGRTLRLSNLDKELFPNGFTKGEVIAYYHEVAPVILPHLAGRAVTRVRFPHGSSAPSFFEKNVPAGTPTWVRTIQVSGSHEQVTYPVVDEVATLIWLANLAALELHTHQWHVDRTRQDVVITSSTPVDHLVIDLDPGGGVSMDLIAAAALLVAGDLADDGLTSYPKTSGSKGLQLYVALPPTPVAAVRDYANALGERLVTSHPDLFVLQIGKAAREHRILLDLNQNLPGRTTISPYSLRGRDRPTVSTPLRWSEVEAAVDGASVVFTASEIPARIDHHGDLFSGLLSGPRTPLPD